MTEKKSKRDFRKAYRFADSIIRDLTGKGLKDALRAGAIAFVETLDNKMNEIEVKVQEPGQASAKVKEAYSTIHCVETDDDAKIKELFKTMVKEFHPDLGQHPNETEFYRIVEAYNLIMKSRHPDVYPD